MVPFYHYTVGLSGLGVLDWQARDVMWSRSTITQLLVWFGGPGLAGEGCCMVPFYYYTEDMSDDLVVLLRRLFFNQYEETRVQMLTVYRL